MNTEMKHTPTPWFARGPHDVSGQATVEVVSNGLRSKIAVLIPSHLCDEHGGSTQANAEFIALACNSYHSDQAKIKALTEALELLALAVERMNDSPAGPAVLAMRTQEARAALSLAKS